MTNQHRTLNDVARSFNASCAAAGLAVTAFGKAYAKAIEAARDEEARIAKAKFKAFHDRQT